MGADEAGLTRSQRMELEELAARLVLGDQFRPEEAVGLAARLVAEGIDGEGLVELASQPADSTKVSGFEVERLLRTTLAELGLPVLSRDAAAWTMARWIATAIVDGVIPPGPGAVRLWNLASECGYPAELVEMLQLEEAWEESVGTARAAAETAIVAFAPEVIAAADRRA
jgi:hypothetical protein